MGRSIGKYWLKFLVSVSVFFKRYQDTNRYRYIYVYTGFVPTAKVSKSQQKSVISLGQQKSQQKSVIFDQGQQISHNQ